MRTLFMLMLCLPLYANAQKLAQNGPDKFTGEYVKETTVEPLKSGWTSVLSYTIRVVEGVPFINFHISTPQSLSMSDSSKVYLALDSGSPIELISNKATVSYVDNSTVYNGAPERTWRATVLCQLSNSDIRALKRSNITAVRFDTSGEPIVFEKIKKAVANNIIVAFEVVGL